jgi:hypothetical protein
VGSSGEYVYNLMHIECAEGSMIVVETCVYAPMPSTTRNPTVNMSFTNTVDNVLPLDHTDPIRGTPFLHHAGAVLQRGAVSPNIEHLRPQNYGIPSGGKFKGMTNKSTMEH